MSKKIVNPVVLLPIVCFAMQGCSTYWDGREAHNLIKQNKVEGISNLQTLSHKEPEKFRYDYLKERDKSTQRLLFEAQSYRQQGDIEAATLAYQSILSYEPQSEEALRGLLLINQYKNENLIIERVKGEIANGKNDSAIELLENLLSINPLNIEAKKIYQGLKESTPSFIHNPHLDEAFKKTVSLKISNVDVRSVLELLAQTSQLNFILDQSVNAELRTTIFANNTSVEDALKLILTTNKLRMKILNDKTLLIYQDSDDKRKQYEELVIRNFYLKNIDPTRIQDMIKNLITVKFINTDEKLKMLTVRDNPDVISVIERLINTYDIADPEVVLEVEVLEVSSSDMLNVGIKYPDQVKLGLNGALSGLTLNQLKSLNSSSYPVFFPDPLAVLNLKQTSGKTKTLANPRIRVTNNQKAKFLIGNKVPVVTTTTNQSSSASSESISYLDVGIRLSVEPIIYINDEVSIKIDMEVSNIAKEIKTTTGMLAYDIGTRNVSTELRLKNGETQVLAGLIKNDQIGSASHLPGLGKIPLIGKLFSDETKKNDNTEIVLLITPRIVRNMVTPSYSDALFASGTNADVSSKPLRLTQAGVYTTQNSQTVDRYIPLPSYPTSSELDPVKQLSHSSPDNIAITPSSNSINPSLLAPSVSHQGNQP